MQPLDTALEAATVARDAKPEDGLTVDGVIVAAYAPGPVAGAVSGRGLRRPKPRSFQADTAPRAEPFNLNNRKPKKGPYPSARGAAPLL